MHLAIGLSCDINASGKCRLLPAFLVPCAMATDTLCFLTGKPATKTAQVPALGWGENFPLAMNFEVTASEKGATTPEFEQQIIGFLFQINKKKAPRFTLEEIKLMEQWVERLARAIYTNVFEAYWDRKLVVIVPRLGIAPAWRDLANELEEELGEAIDELFGSKGPYERFDYQFFEAETDIDADSVLWFRMPGGAEAYVWPIPVDGSLKL